MRVLVVDDSQVMRGILKRALKHVGVKHIDEACNGIDALKLYEVGKYGLVITDIIMDDMDGIELIKQIRGKTDSQMMVVCSSMGQQDFVVEAMKNGAMDFIIKPFKVDGLIHHLRQILEKVEYLGKN